VDEVRFPDGRPRLRRSVERLDDPHVGEAFPAPGLRIPSAQDAVPRADPRMPVLPSTWHRMPLIHILEPFDHPN